VNDLANVAVNLLQITIILLFDLTEFCRVKRFAKQLGKVGG
jgi:hypothetical protein